MLIDETQQTLVVDASNFYPIDDPNLFYFDVSLNVWYGIFIQIYVGSFNEDEEFEQLSTFVFEAREHLESIDDITEADLNEANERFLRANEAILDSYFATTRSLANILSGYKVNQDDYVVDEVYVSRLDSHNALITIHYSPYDRANDPYINPIVKHLKDKAKAKVASKPRIYQPVGLL